jgi:anthranilate phosphoribosyltransferase
MTTFEPFPAARFIKEIGRGKNGARSMSRDDARDLYQAMLDGRVSDLELGGILLSMRIKGESVDEIAGFLDAAEAALNRSRAAGPVRAGGDPDLQRRAQDGQPDAAAGLLLAREGVPVLVHGVATDLGRVARRKCLPRWACRRRATARGGGGHVAAQAGLHHHRYHGAQAGLSAVAAAQAGRAQFDPHAGQDHAAVCRPALRLVSYTHPEYLEMLGEYFTTAAPHERGDAFLMRGTEGETVANANKAQQIDWFHGGLRTTLVPKQTLVGELPLLENKDAATTAAWIKPVLDGEVPVPPPIAEQVAQCLLVSRTCLAPACERADSVECPSSFPRRRNPC